MRCLYEVTLHIHPSLAGEYDPWLQTHVADMLALPGFISARIYTVEPDQENPGTLGRVVHYQLENRQAFDDYLNTHAERMRNEGLSRFGNRVTASRRILLPAT